jgi:hypothetical protein
VPWTQRNALEYDRFLLLDTSGGETMYFGNNDFPPMTTDRKLHRRAVGGGCAVVSRIRRRWR